jgi:hypothetical protein
MSDEQLLEVIGQRTKNERKIEHLTAQRDDMIVAMRGVTACFNSRTESSTCAEDHHPSCHEYLTLVLKRVTGGK